MEVFGPFPTAQAAHRQILSCFRPGEEGAPIGGKGALVIHVFVAIFGRTAADRKTHVVLEVGWDRSPIFLGIGAYILP